MENKKERKEWLEAMSATICGIVRHTNHVTPHCQGTHGSAQPSFKGAVTGCPCPTFGPGSLLSLPHEFSPELFTSGTDPKWGSPSSSSPSLITNSLDAETALIFPADITDQTLPISAVLSQPVRHSMALWSFPQNTYFNSSHCHPIQNVFQVLSSHSGF